MYIYPRAVELGLLAGMELCAAFFLYVIILAWIVK